MEKGWWVSLSVDREPQWFSVAADVPEWARGRIQRQGPAYGRDETVAMSGDAAWVNPGPEERRIGGITMRPVPYGNGQDTPYVSPY